MDVGAPSGANGDATAFEEGAYELGTGRECVKMGGKVGEGVIAVGTWELEQLAFGEVVFFSSVQFSLTRFGGRRILP